MQVAQRSAKRQKPSSESAPTEGGGGVYSFHPEDEVIQKVGLDLVLSLINGRYRCAIGFFVHNKTYDTS